MTQSIPLLGGLTAVTWGLTIYFYGYWAKNAVTFHAGCMPAALIL
jgi:hypothetical protein